jgi:hypothetical protein
MEILLTTHSTFTAVALTLVVGALLVAQLVTSAERRLVAATALILAGVFFTSRPDAEAALTAAGAICWLGGLGLFAREGLAWDAASASKVGPLAVVFLLPPALLGAVLGVGALLSALLAPARLALRLMG